MTRLPALLVSAGACLRSFELDVDDARVEPRGSIDLPANVQYAWPNARADVLYVATSNGGPGGANRRGDRHHVAAVGIDPRTRELALLAQAQPLAARPIHLTTDGDSAHVVVTYNDPPGVTVHRVERDGGLGATVPQAGSLDYGIYPHQGRVAPSSRFVVVVARGNSATPGRREDPGSLNVFGYRDGVLAPHARVAPGDGYGFGPRHVDFHPAAPWLFASLERQNELHVFRCDADGSLSAAPVHRCSTLARPGAVRDRQLAGTLHVHPRGHVLYVANRALGLRDVDGRKVGIGGETTLTVFAIDAGTGALARLQAIETHGASPRTFALDPTGRLLLAANSVPRLEATPQGIVETPRSVALFAVADDGTLRHRRTHAFEDAAGDLLWMNVVA